MRVLMIAVLGCGAVLGQALPPDIDAQSKSRLPLVKRSSLDDEGKRVFDMLNGGKVQELPARTGPAANTMYSPPVAEAFEKMNQAVRGTVAGQRAFEICTLVAAREFDQQYEWNSHEVTAKRAGVEQNVIDSIKFNRDLDGLSEKDRVLIQFGRDSLRRHRIDSTEYAKMAALFGQRGTLELAAAIGDYIMTAVVLNAIDQRIITQQVDPLPVK
jgi:4-carboxymuconolactone decarboxylase